MTTAIPTGLKCVGLNQRPTGQTVTMNKIENGTPFFCKSYVFDGDIYPMEGWAEKVGPYLFWYGGYRHDSLVAIRQNLSACILLAPGEVLVLASL